MLARAAAALLLAMAVKAQEGTCPPTGLKPVAPFDLAAYVSEPWYVQKQAPNSYQPVDSLYCVRAKYGIVDPAASPVRVNVNNYSKRGSVSGTVRGGDLAAVVRGENEGRLAVGPSFLPDFLKGPYWVVHFDNDAGEAIITGGAPTVVDETTGLCRGAAGSIFNPNGNGEGLWLFTREKTPSSEAVEALTQKAKDLGLDPSVLVRVEQEGCVYPEDA